jgi:hypothetical protein
MSASGEREDNLNKSSPFEKWGCAIFILATVLLTLERYLIFAVLLQQADRGNQAAEHLVVFLFGNPPFSIFDVLLGLSLPDEGLLFLLQPRNLVVLAIQAAHFGMNLGLVYIPFWFVSKIRQAARPQETEEAAETVGGQRWLLLSTVAGVAGGLLEAVVIVSTEIVSAAHIILSSNTGTESARAMTHAAIGCCGAVLRWLAVPAGAGFLASYLMLRSDVRFATLSRKEVAIGGAVAGALVIIVDTIGVVLVSLLIPSPATPAIYFATLCMGQAVALCDPSA